MHTRLTINAAGMEILGHPTRVGARNGRGKGGSAQVFALPSDAKNGFSVTYQGTTGVVNISDDISRKWKYPEGERTLIKSKQPVFAGQAYILRVPHQDDETAPQVTATTVDSGNVGDESDPDVNSDSDDVETELDTDGGGEDETNEVMEAEAA